MWWYKIHLYGRVWDYEGHDFFVSEEPFETPEFDLQDRKSIERIVKQRYPNCKDCSGVQVFFYEQFDPDLRREQEESKRKQEKEQREREKKANKKENSYSSTSSSSKGLTGWVFKILWWIIKLPFKLIWWLFK